MTIEKDDERCQLCNSPLDHQSDEPCIFELPEESKAPSKHASQCNHCKDLILIVTLRAELLVEEKVISVSVIGFG